MPAAHELLEVGLPMASLTSNPAILVAAGAGILGAAVNIKKITPYLHTTIYDGEVGVLFRSGKPVERKDLTPEKLEAIESGESDESRYVVLPPKFYFVPPFRSVERVYTSHNQDDIMVSLDSHADDPEDRDQMVASAKATWHVSPKGDAPVYSLTRVKHIKETKKEDSEKTKEEERYQELRAQVLSILIGGFGRITSSMTVEQLSNFNQDTDAVNEAMQEECGHRLALYGVNLAFVDPLPVFRAPEEMNKQGMEAIAEAIRTRPEALEDLLRGSQNGHGRHRSHSDHQPVEPVTLHTPRAATL